MNNMRACSEMLFLQVGDILGSNWNFSPFRPPVPRVLRLALSLSLLLCRSACPCRLPHIHACEWKRRMYLGSSVPSFTAGSASPGRSYVCMHTHT